jgi:hypothetical protein
MDGGDSHWNILVLKQGPLNTQVAGNMPDVARGGILNEKMSFSPFPGKVEAERRRYFENL